MKKVFGKLFSKLIIVSIMILLQIAWICVMFYAASTVSDVFNIIIKLIALGYSLYISSGQTKVYIKLSWIFLLLCFPVIGVPCYLLFGRPNLTKKASRRLKVIEDSYMNERVNNPKIDEIVRQQEPDLALMTEYLQNITGYPMYSEDTSRYFSSGEEAFESLIEDLKSAREYIFMEYFILATGSMMDQIFDILKEKAREGVKVKFIYDDFGSINFISKKFPKEMAEYGIEVLDFNPYVPFLSIIMNNRDHRKITIIDGRIAHTGGYNIADEYINKIVRFGYWKDAGIRITGDGVNSFTTMFLEMWNYISKTNIPMKEYIRKENNYNGNKGFVLPFADSPLDSEVVAETVYINLISRAKKYVYIFTPYLIVDSEVSFALTTAAKSGVDVRIVTPGIPDKKLVYLQTKSNFINLIKGGVKIYRYDKGFIHSKCVVSDDTKAFVGTANLDFRSLYWHFEDGVFLYNTDSVMDVKQDMLDTFEESSHISLEECQNQNVFLRLLQSVVQLFSPLL